MNKAITYILGSTVILLLLFFSLDIRKLDAYRASQTDASFDAGAYAREVWDHKIPGVARQKSAAPGELIQFITL